MTQVCEQIPLFLRLSSGVHHEFWPHSQAEKGQASHQQSSYLEAGCPQRAKIQVWAGLVVSGSSRGESIFCLFQLLEASRGGSGPFLHLSSPPQWYLHKLQRILDIWPSFPLVLGPSLQMSALFLETSFSRGLGLRQSPFPTGHTRGGSPGLGQGGCRRVKKRTPSSGQLLPH